ncbi:hypothetical protein EV11_1367 [Prochlorococcus sp. SS52]|nr:hypothetical protein EV04_1088 [Prochlorococcus marinus str. LG]KGG18485.1 hypothetical protein EV08_1730 [Prochlorococcus marinus str. SS2]KGG22758.1 hypothetical protein EV09_1497 [Prochlorococcus marinus str. SS35]KGG32634.1 hypothetical protein EV10_0950 [Prochlorococcus marinus str. SS51]KGG35417.1 hypothetical protein EV11_1367 [Prochlorococcus sp. SS52]
MGKNLLHNFNLAKYLQIENQKLVKRNILLRIFKFICSRFIK